MCFRKFVDFIAKNEYRIESGKEKITFVCFHFIFSESSTASSRDSCLTLPTSEINQSTPHFQNKVVLQTKQYSLSLSEVEIKKRNSGENGSHQLSRWEVDGMVWKRKRILHLTYIFYFLPASCDTAGRKQVTSLQISSPRPLYVIGVTRNYLYFKWLFFIFLFKLRFVAQISFGSIIIVKTLLFYLADSVFIYFLFQINNTMLFIECYKYRW